MKCKGDRYQGLKCCPHAYGLEGFCRDFPSADSCSSSKKITGLSLVELMVTLSIFVILIAASAPPLKGLIITNRIANVADELYGSIMLARSEAIKRRQTVALCSTVNNQTCNTASTGWQSGWLIFTDAAEDGLLNDNDVLLRRVSEPSELLSIAWNRGYSLRFNSRGQTKQAGTFKVCDQTGSSQQPVAIVISRSGRMRVEELDACS